MRARFGDLATPVTSLPYDPLTTTNRMFISALPIICVAILCLALLSPETGAARVSDLDSIRTVITAPQHQAGHDRMTWVQFSSTVLMQPQDCSATTASPSPHRELLDQVLAGAPSHFDWRDRGVISPVKNQVGRAHFRHISHGRHGLTEAGTGASTVSNNPCRHAHGCTCRVIAAHAGPSPPPAPSSLTMQSNMGPGAHRLCRSSRQVSYAAGAQALLR